MLGRCSHANVHSLVEYTGWLKINPLLLIVLTNFIFSALSMAYPDVLCGAYFEVTVNVCSRASSELVKRDIRNSLSLFDIIHHEL